jgi:hypothetical protein
MAIKKTVIAALLVVMASLTSACVGPMNATSRLKTWNREIENRWAGEGVYVLLRLPWGGVYGLFFLSDVLVFNAIEFWGGDNPVDPVSPQRLQQLRQLDARRHEPGR